MVVNKPAGILSHPNAGGADSKQRAAFHGHYDLKEKSFRSPACTLWLIHRLDQDTSGVLMAAKDLKTADRLREAFEETAVRKTYLALVSGQMRGEGPWLDHLITARERRQVRTTVLKGRPPNAELHYRVLGSQAHHRLSLLEIQLITGKTHQIRVQSSSRHHPLIGDDVYGNFDLNRRLRKELGIRRLFLHAKRIEFKHPASGQRLAIEAPLPDELLQPLEKLGLRV